MFKKIHKSQPKSHPYDVRNKTASKDVFTFFGLLSPKEVLKKTYRRRRMSSLRRDASSRNIREGSFIAKDDNYYRKNTATILREILYLTLHFILVLTVLLSAAVIFAKIEDSPLNEVERPNISTDAQEILTFLKKDYNLTISAADLDNFFDGLNRMAVGFTKLKRAKIEETKVHDGKFVFKKWFYFASIASTTIGYGDVAPKTREGRIIYIIFSITAIPLMLSFIISCGDKIRRLVTGLLSLFKQCVAGQQDKGSSFHLLASLMIFITFAGHFSIGCALIPDSNKWTLVDKIYHHVATFTTVGMGDVIEPLEDQVHNAVPLFFYRVFGLVLLYAALKSFHSWYKVKREAFAVRKLIQRPLKSRRKMSALACIKANGHEEPKLESTMLI